MLATVLGSDGSGGELLIVPGRRQPPARPATRRVSSGNHFIKMNGREVFRFATHDDAQGARRQCVRKAGWQLAELSTDHPAPGQRRASSNRRPSGWACREDKFFVNLDRYGNTSAASIPIALCEAIAAGRIKPGDKLVLVGFGAGLTWAAAAIEWGVPIPGAAAPLVAPFMGELPVLVGRRPLVLPAHRAPRLQLGHGAGGQGRLARQAEATGGQVPHGREEQSEGRLSPQNRSPKPARLRRSVIHVHSWRARSLTTPRETRSPSTAGSSSVSSAWQSAHSLDFTSNSAGQRITVLG